MTDRIPLAEQLDEIAAEYTRRCRDYPLLVSKGDMRQSAAELKIERMAAAHNTLAWLSRNADHVREWMLYAVKVTPKAGRADLIVDAPPDFEPEIIPDEPAKDAAE